MSSRTFPYSKTVPATPFRKFQVGDAIEPKDESARSASRYTVKGRQVVSGVSSQGTTVTLDGHPRQRFQSSDFNLLQATAPKEQELAMA
jgi:hypothetical protein